MRWQRVINALKRYTVLQVKTRLNAKKLPTFKPLALKLIQNALCVWSRLTRRLFSREFIPNNNLISKKNFKSLYTDIRNLLSFVKENHGGTFRKIAFAALLEPLVKLKQENQQRLLRLGQIDTVTMMMPKVLQQIKSLYLNYKLI